MRVCVCGWVGVRECVCAYVCTYIYVFNMCASSYSRKTHMHVCASFWYSVGTLYVKYYYKQHGTKLKKDPSKNKTFR